jgi:SAM-dependent methyltransferase
LTREDRGRVEAAYAGYRSSARKRRAWDARNPGNAAIRDELAAAVLAAVDLQGDVLDAGCGTGWWLRRLRDEGVPAERLHGIELQPERVDAAAATGAAVAAGDVRALAYEDGRFGAVFLFTVLSSLAGRDDVVRAVAEARRVLAPGGALVVWEPRVPNPLNRHTRLVRPRDLGPGVRRRTLTPLPWLVRRLPRSFPVAAALPPLRTHRLYVARR